ncbi:sensor histidine kinase [Allohahella marinimesophila]|uniref:histidine kinase n=1 Tax=Allohahella marinimesophila TaxID=1054972 RepID=A0ABP7NX50_9GAMM
MNRPLLWKFCLIIAAGSVALFWLVSLLTLRTEQAMSFIAEEHQDTLVEYGETAEALYLAGDMVALNRWLADLQLKEQTWAAVVRSSIEPLAGSLSSTFVDSFRLGRNVEWKIHLYFTENPIMDITFADRHTHFLITLPQRMRPGMYWQQANILLQLGLPLLLLILLSVLLYRHLVTPLRQLELATRQFSEGKYDVRVQSGLGSRKDEITALAATFDRMAERTGTLILTQRQLIADLSHEIRTPLTRIDVAVSCIEQGIEPDMALARIRRDSVAMRRLAEDTLTLAWLENERPRLDQESLDLSDLIDSILDDARFEFPDRSVEAVLPEVAPLPNSSHRVLAQAIENIVRNALRFTPPGGEVSVKLEREDSRYRLDISDQGAGVPEANLQDIFKPFFRLDKARERVRGGFGLGLALARRQVEAAGGIIQAGNRPQGGLVVMICLPLVPSGN